MRVVSRVVAVVCLVAVSFGLDASPREPKAGNVVKKVVKKIVALGDLITIPVGKP